MPIDHETLTLEVDAQIAAMRDDPALFEPYDVNGNGVLDADEEARLRTLLTTRAVLAHSDAHPPANHTGPGRVLAGRFEMLDAIGKGGQGSTWRALDRDTGADVVVKELHLELAENWKAIELFERECGILQQLNHPGIPAFIAAFTASEEEGADGLGFFLVQELIDGRDLQAALDQGQHFDESTVRRLLAEVLDILTYLHGRTPPVVHRDIKPANLILRGDGSVALVDFGATGEQVTGHTVGSTMVGTSGYMAPEQLMGRTVTASDQYGLAATAVHLLCRRHPGDLPMRRMRLQFADAVHASKPLVQVLERMLDPMVESRFATPRDALEALLAPVSASPEGAMARTHGADRAAGTVSHSLKLAGSALLAVVVFFLVVLVASEGSETPRGSEAVSAPEASHAMHEPSLDVAMRVVAPDSGGVFAGLGGARTSMTHAFGKTFEISGVVTNSGDYDHTELKVQVDAYDGDARLGGKVVTLVPSYAPPLRPGDHEPFHFYLALPKVPSRVDFRPLTSEANSVPTNGYRPTQRVELEWVAARPPGVRLAAKLRRDETSRYGSHTLWLEIENLGDRPVSLIKLGKRLYAADGGLLLSKESYVHGSSDPPLPAGHSYRVSLLSNSKPGAARWTVQVVEVDVWEPPQH